ncbi:HtaA domain-containing protein [Georgenia satyanarayanai]|uniref:HtaA domain-containing protein n=1 Tax=Georgenia satyanarayanai TaxID=860221 RepID=UPI0012655FC5|nr:HtaA domain-containing protein [Georgenia satyanarayanai]
MSTTTWRARARRTLAAVTTTALAAGAVVVGTGTTALAAEPAATVESGSAQWGVKESFRRYVQSPIAHGSVTPVAPATQLDDGRLGFVADSGTVEGTTARIDLAGGVSFAGHDSGEGPVLEVHLSDVRVVIDGDAGSLVADVTSRAFVDTTTLGELVEYPGVEVGAIDLSATPLTVTDGVASLVDAPVTLTADGVPAFAGFYEAGDALDPLSFSVELAPTTVAPQVTLQPQDVSVDQGGDAVFSAAATGTPEPTVQWQTRPGGDTEWQDVADATAADLTLPAVTRGQDGTQVRAVFSNGTEPDAVSETATLTVAATPVEPEEPTGWEPAIEVFAADGVTPVGDAQLTDGDTVVVRGTGFDPAANVGGRGVPIPSTLPQGTYVVLGKFAERWQPSQDAPSSARVVGAQKWALAEGVLDQVPASFQDAIRRQWVNIAEDGSFTAELTVTEPAAGWPEDGAFGVYTYAAGGVTNPAQELSVPLTVVEEPTEPEQPVEWTPAIEVLAADGVTPVGDAPLTYGDTIVVRGTGFDPAGNVGGRGVPIPSTLPQGTYVVFGSFTDQWRPSQDAPSSNRVIGAQKWALAEGVLDQVPPSFQGAIRGQWVDIAEDGSFTAELTLGGLGKAWPQDGTFGVYTYGAGGVKNPAQELSAPLNFLPGPQIEVLTAAGTPVGDSQLVEGDTVVVKGTGFDPAGNVGGRGVPIPSTLPQGTYVVLGKFAEQWQPSLDAPSSARAVGDQRWALAEDVLDQVPASFQGAIRQQWVDIAEDGSFTAELTVTEPAAGWPEDGAFGVYTYAAGGVKNPAQELSVPLTVVEERAPRLAVTPTEDLAVGTVVSVEGTGYAPNRTISVAFTPNEVKNEEFGWPEGWLQHETVETDALGSFSHEVTVHGWVTGTGDDCSVVQCFVATFSSAQLADATPVDHRADRSQDVFVPVTFVGGTAEPTPEPGEPTVVANPGQVEQGGTVDISGSNLPAGDVTVQVAPRTSPATGHLDWGVKESFRSYVASPIAHGEITTGDGVTVNDDGTFRFRVTSASQDPAAGTSLVSFAGSVRFEGHEIDGVPALDIRLENLRVQVTPESAVLVADATSREFAGTTSTGEPVEYPGVVLATLDPEAFAVEGDTLRASGAAATLTAAGEPAFGTFYDAGEELDPVSVEVTVGGTVPAALALVTEEPIEIAVLPVGEDGLLDTSWTVPQTFPVGGYAVVLRDDAGAVLASDALTVVAAVPGEPGEPGGPGVPAPEPEPTRGTVVVDPDPVTRGTTATLTGSGLEPGTRVGAVIDAAGAPGSLEWGVKESFRSYITGAIAHGSVTVTAPAAETGDGFVFGDGRGNGDASDGTAHFGGQVTFAGHEIGGITRLQMTITDPSVVIEGGAGYLVADVTSRSLEGVDVVDYPRVRLAELDLDGVRVADGRLVGTDVPATLTAEGVPAFADFYEAGDALDPLTFSVPVAEGQLDLSELDVAEAVVGQDGTVELTWTAPADIALGSHRVDLVTDGKSVADTTFTVVAVAGPGDDDGAGTGTAARGGGDLAQTGADVAALAALAAAVVLAGAVIATRRQRA